MSFSLPQSSSELSRAVDYATGAGTICVASAGNDSSPAPVYPAGYSDVISVASTDDNDNRSNFSNYGPWIWLAAPGEQIVTTYPWGTYAAASGTSFSAPFVLKIECGHGRSRLLSGTVSLLLQTRWNLSQPGAANDVAHAKPVVSDLGHGRLDIVQTLQAAILGN